MQIRRFVHKSFEQKNVILLKIGDDFAEGLLELSVEFPVEHFLVVARLRSEYGPEKLLVDLLQFVRSHHNRVRLEDSRSCSCDLKQF